MRKLLVREAMVKDPITIRPEAPVIEAAKLIRDKAIGSVIVADEKNVLGIVTERDLTRRVMAEDKDPKKVRVSDVMSSPIVSIAPDREAGDAAQLMRKKGIRRLAVMNGNELVGIITSDDLTRNMQRAVEELAATICIMESRRA